MIVNPVNVINLLLATFQTMYLTETPITREETFLAEKFKELLLDTIFQFNVEIHEEQSLDFQEPFKESEIEIIDDDDDNKINWTEENELLGICSEKDTDVDFEYKRTAVEYWKNADGGKKRRKFHTVQHMFRRLSSERQLRRWAQQVEAGGTRKDKLLEITEFVMNKFNDALNAGFIVHDRDLRRWALEAYRNQNNNEMVFTASGKWIYKFKKAHRIVSRKITKFVTRKSIEDSEVLKQKAVDFVSEVKPLIKQYGIQNVYNTDQSGFQLELHSGRTLAVEGQKKVECVVQSISSTTHSYTIQPIISADGRLLTPLFMVLKEPSGKFGPVVEGTLFRPSNVFVTASKSGKLTSDHFNKWVKEVFFPNTGSTSVLLLDSWTGHCTDTVEKEAPAGKTVIPKVIPKGTTGMIQPLDVYGFRVWKNFVKRFSDDVLLHNYEINLHLRNNIIKLQSLVHNQLSSPRYKNLFQYSWYKSGYVDNRPQDFENPVDFAFGESSQYKCAYCDETPVIRCSWCKKSLCIKHFFHDHHMCNKYEE